MSSSISYGTITLSSGEDHFNLDLNKDHIVDALFESSVNRQNLSGNGYISEKLEELNNEYQKILPQIRGHQKDLKFDCTTQKTLLNICRTVKHLLFPPCIRGRGHGSLVLIDEVFHVPKGFYKEVIAKLLETYYYDDIAIEKFKKILEEIEEDD